MTPSGAEGPAFIASSDECGYRRGQSTLHPHLLPSGGFVVEPHLGMH